MDATINPSTHPSLHEKTWLLPSPRMQNHSPIPERTKASAVTGLIGMKCGPIWIRNGSSKIQPTKPRTPIETTAILAALEKAGNQFRDMFELNPLTHTL